MAENQYKNKIVYGGDTLIDLTEDTVTADTLLSGTTAHDKSGAPVRGTYTAPVTSVNEQTGDVQLTATDVGALPISGGTLTGSLDMGFNAITNLLPPGGSTEAVNKDYADNLFIRKISGTIGTNQTSCSIQIPFTPTGTQSSPDIREAWATMNGAYIMLDISYSASGMRHYMTFTTSASPTSTITCYVTYVNSAPT